MSTPKDNCKPHGHPRLALVSYRALHNYAKTMLLSDHVKLDAIQAQSRYLPSRSLRSCPALPVFSSSHHLIHIISLVCYYLFVTFARINLLCSYTPAAVSFRRSGMTIPALKRCNVEILLPSRPGHYIDNLKDKESRHQLELEICQWRL